MFLEDRQLQREKIFKLCWLVLLGAPEVATILVVVVDLIIVLFVELEEAVWSVVDLHGEAVTSAGGRCVCVEGAPGQ